MTQFPAPGPRRPGAPNRSGKPQSGKRQSRRKTVLGVVAAAAFLVLFDRGAEIAARGFSGRAAGEPTALLAAAGPVAPAAGAATPGAAASGAAAGQSSVYEALEVFSGALMLIRDQYLEPVEADALMDGAVRGIFTALDPDSAYLNADEARLYRNRADAAGTIGIGLQKRYYLHVDDVLPGSPAAAAGIERGDAITAIGGRSTRDIRIPVAHLLLAGPPGSPVELSLRSTADSDSRVVSLERAELPPPPVEHEMIGEGIGLVRIRRFHEQTPAQLAAAVRSLQEGGAAALALDLRGSRGAGEGCEAGAEAAAVFMDGAVARLIRRNGEGEETSVPIEAPPANALFSGPLAAIINTGTVCPGEVLAAALASREETDLVGLRTSGRTGRPELIALPEGDAVLLSTSHIRGVEGDDILGAGVPPTLSAADLGLEPEDLDEEDPALDMAVRALEHRRAAAKNPA